MRKTAIGIGATATAGYGIASDRGPVGNAQAFPPALIPAAAAVGFLAYGEFIADDDEQPVDDALAYQQHLDEFTRYQQEEISLDETLASLARDVQLVANKAREDAIFAIYEQAVDSGTTASATTAAENAIHEAYAVVERAILGSFTLRANRFQNVASMMMADVSKYADNRDRTRWHRAYFGEARADEMGSSARNTVIWTVDDADKQLTTNTRTLLNGESYDYSHFQHEHSYSGDNVQMAITADPDVYDAAQDTTLHVYAHDLLAPDAADYDTVDSTPTFGSSTVTAIDAKRWVPIYKDLISNHDAMITEVSSMVDTYYQPAVDGDIDLHNMIGPEHLSDTASTAEDYQEAAMALRAMGYPMSDQVCTVSITDDEGETHERIGRLSWTAHDGNTLAVGTELNPDNIVGSVFFAHNEPQEDGSTVGQTRELNRPFTIETAEGSDGVSFEDRALVEAETQLTNEEIQQLFVEHYEANEEARENVHDTATDGGGAGGFLDGDASDIRTLGIVAGGAALAALLFGGNN